MSRKAKQRESSDSVGAVEVRPLTPRMLDDLAQVLKGSWGATCFCMCARLKDAQLRALPGDGPAKERRRSAMAKLARRKTAPGLLAYRDGEPVGWVAVGPRRAYARVDASRATPRFDDQDVWIIPCVTVSKTARGHGIAVVLIRAAADYALAQGAPVIEAYPRAGDKRAGDDNVYFGTEPLFRRAGFELVRGPLRDRPKNWLPRLVMRYVGEPN